MIGWMACSLAGHDKNKIYIIIEETDETVWLADGDIRKIEKPKSKRRKHIRIIKKIMDHSLVEKLTDRNEKDNDYINVAMKRAIKLYKQSLTKQQEIVEMEEENVKSRCY